MDRWYKLDCYTGSVHCTAEAVVAPLGGTIVYSEVERHFVAIVKPNIKLAQCTV